MSPREVWRSRRLSAPDTACVISLSPSTTTNKKSWSCADLPLHRDQRKLCYFGTHPKCASRVMKEFCGPAGVCHDQRNPTSSFHDFSDPLASRSRNSGVMSSYEAQPCGPYSCEFILTMKTAPQYRCTLSSAIFATQSGMQLFRGR